MTPDETLRQACEELADWFYRFHPNDTDSVNRLIAFAKAQRAAEARACAELCDQHHAKDHWYITRIKEWIMKRAAEWEEKA